MKKIGLTLASLFFLHHFLNQIMRDYREIKISILLLVILLLSVHIISHFLKCKSPTKEFTKVFIMTFVMFELSKFSAFILGYLPKYNETPFFISFFLSFISIAFYLLFLTGLSFVLKKLTLWHNNN